MAHIADADRPVVNHTADEWALEDLYFARKARHDEIDARAEATKACIRGRVTKPDFLAEMLDLVDKAAANEHAAVA